MKPLLNRKYLAVLACFAFAASTSVSGQVTVAVAAVDNPIPAITAVRVGVQQASPLPLSLDDAIRRGLANNNDIEISRTDVRFSEQSLRAAKGVYDPVLSFAPNYSRSQTTGGRATNDFTLGADASGFIKPGGGTYGGFFNNNRTENAFAQQQASSGTVNSSGTSAIFTSSLGFQYTQPLLRNFAIDRNRQQIKIARRRLAQSDTDFRLQATTTISQVQRAYWDLVFALRDQQNQQANVSLARENLRQIEARIAAGASAPIERAEIETELANREGLLLSSIQQVGIAENALKQLVLKDVTAPEWQQTIVPTDKPAFSLERVSLDNALRDATDNRFELKRLRLENEINQVDVAFFRNQVKPQLDLNSRFSLNGLSQGGTNSAFTTNLFTSPGDIVLFNAINQIRATPNVNLPPIANPNIAIPAQPAFLFGGFNRSLANLFRSDAPNYSFGVTISFPLRNRTAKANLAGARITGERIAAQTRSQEQTVIVEVRNAVQSVETSRQRVLTARRARESAETQLEGERKLYEAGRSTTFLLFQRENTLNNARNAEIRAETDYNKAVAELQRATATSFRENNITIDTPVDLP
ncbi:MAG: TolC family protein [Blastocatellia bacterium]|nr:TolC family protein [Blastocatellia bacterium]